MNCSCPGRALPLAVWSAGAPPRPPVIPSAGCRIPVRRASSRAAAPWGVPPPGWDGSSASALDDPRSPGRSSGGPSSCGRPLGVASSDGFIGKSHVASHHRPHPRRRSPANRFPTRKKRLRRTPDRAPGGRANTTRPTWYPGDPTGDLAVAANARAGAIKAATTC